MVHFLVGLVALAAQGDHIAGLRVVHRPVDGLHPVADHLVGGAAALQARQDVGDDGLRVLGPRVVGGHHHKVRQLRRHAAHNRPLGPVPVAAAAEQGHGASLGKALHGAKNILQTIRRVGVVDQDRVVLSRCGDHFHPPLHMGNCSQHPGALFQRNAQSQSRTQHIQRIIYHKPAGNANFDGRAAILCHRIEGDVVRRKGDMLRPQVCRGVLCIEVLPTCGVLQQPLCPGIVGVADAHVAVLEQDGLGVAVGFHGLVEIQVVLGQVGENAHRVVDTVHPIQRQSVGGCLHHHMGAAGRAHPGKQLLELQGLRCGTLSGHHLVADQILVGADQAHLGPQLLFQDGLEQIGGGGLAVGAGDGHHGHAVCRMAVIVGGHHRQGPAGVLHQDIGHGAVLRRSLTHHRGGSRRHGLSDIGVAVGGKAGHGHEDVPGCRGPGIIADTGDLHLHVRGGGPQGEPCQQRFQMHCMHTPFVQSGSSLPSLIINKGICKVYGGRCQKPCRTCFLNPGQSCRRTGRSPPYPPPPPCPQGETG